ncbi:MAG: hypothetical protein ABIH34_03530 [Nanoarchaeota archaeon]
MEGVKHIRKQNKDPPSTTGDYPAARLLPKASQEELMFGDDELSFHLAKRKGPYRPAKYYVSLRRPLLGFEL